MYYKKYNIIERDINLYNIVFVLQNLYNIYVENSQSAQFLSNHIHTVYAKENIPTERATHAAIFLRQSQRFSLAVKIAPIYTIVRCQWWCVVCDCLQLI